ncbi:hypothetical protein ACFQE5_12620 [Pseudonocardia hispaniensis]|uniref:Bacterial EndoU nuclease domain-containing protein n=1 Tax=Pseudonocardia hispaniensis TaxID=904933 RepID=A0ABW1J2R8_9PSEU
MPGIDGGGRAAAAAAPSIAGSVRSECHRSGRRRDLVRSRSWRYVRVSGAGSDRRGQGTIGEYWWTCAAPGLCRGGAQASTPWGACGNSTPESKEVAHYSASPRINYHLRCGNVKYGYRHIVANHRADFENRAAGTYQNWRDVADLAMDAISRDPDKAVPRGGGKACLSRVIFLRNVRTNQVVRQRIVRMIVAVDHNNIITAFPHDRQFR